MECYLNLISVQLVPSASVVADSVAEIKSGQADRLLETISLQSVSTNDETQERPELQPVQAEGYPDIISAQSVPVASVQAEPAPINDGTQTQLQIQAKGHISIQFRCHHFQLQ